MEAGSDIGHHTKWNFSMEKCPSKDFIKSKVDISPVAIAFDITHNFQFIGNLVRSQMDWYICLSVIQVITWIN